MMVKQFTTLIVEYDLYGSINKKVNGGATQSFTKKTTALDINIAMISGFTWEFVEFDCEVRIINRSVCSGCWTWARFDRGDWNWCPQNKGNERQFECTKTITPENVWQQLETSGKFGI
jgi:autotransporter strand-loop-strand O-heptosyltransferase